LQQRDLGGACGHHRALMLFKEVTRKQLESRNKALTYFWKSASPYYFTYAQARA